VSLDSAVLEFASASTPTPPEGDAKSAPKKGKGAAKDKPERAVDWGRYNELLRRFVLIYSTDTAFDTKERLIIKVNALRLAFGHDYVKMWLNSDDRRMILPSELVFDPTGTCRAPCINLFDGLPVAPAPGDCGPIVELLEYLCSAVEIEGGHADDVALWVLRWLAFPLQHPGAKMKTALVFHGPQGAGKNLFFEVMTAIYGRFGMVVGQDQLEDKFNDWASQKLFLIGDEVVARAELYHTKNKLKALITGETIQINTKMLPLRTETNHCNLTFLSNEVQPLALEPGDRRYCVVYTPPADAKGLYERVAECLRNGGHAAFLSFLLKLDLADFTEHTKPPLTSSKKDLIELGLTPEQRFVSEWRAGFLPLPLVVCSASQLYRAFRKWAAVAGERFPPAQARFTAQVCKSGAALTYKVIKLDSDANGKRAERMWVPPGCAAPAGVTEGRWAAECSEHFEELLFKFIGQESES
jgi:putative DNA primase/helicase